MKKKGSQPSKYFNSQPWNRPDVLLQKSYFTDSSRAIGDFLSNRESFTIEGRSLKAYLFPKDDWED